MEITAKFDIKCIEEDGTLDEAVMNKLKMHCVSMLEKNVMKELNEVIKKSFTSKIENKIGEILNDFLFNKPILITDSWGDKKSEYENGMELLKTRFDNFINQPVNKDGKPVTKQCTYGKHESRIEYLIKQNLLPNFDKIKNEVKKEITDNIQSKIKDIKENLAKETVEKLLNIIDLEAGIKAKTDK